MGHPGACRLGESNGIRPAGPHQHAVQLQHRHQLRELGERADRLQHHRRSRPDHPVLRFLKTFHDVAVGTANPNDPIIDPTQQQVITYIANTANVELAMGTLNSALAQGGFGQPWAPGLMTSSTYTDKWVQMIIDAFGSTAKAQAHLKVILLGNEIDQNGPPPGDPSFGAYQGWIQQSFDNLSASLSKYGLASIPASTTIANYGPSNAVAVNISAYIQSHWSTAWVGGKPVVFYNQYTQGPSQAPMSSTDYAPSSTTSSPSISNSMARSNRLSGKPAIRLFTARPIRSRSTSRYLHGSLASTRMAAGPFRCSRSMPSISHRERRLSKSASGSSPRTDHIGRRD